MITSIIWAYIVFCFVHLLRIQDECVSSVILWWFHCSIWTLQLNGHTLFLSVLKGYGFLEIWYMVACPGLFVSLHWYSECIHHMIYWVRKWLLYLMKCHNPWLLLGDIILVFDITIILYWKDLCFVAHTFDIFYGSWVL